MDLFLIPVFFSLLFVLILLVYIVPLDVAFAGSAGMGEPAARITTIWGFLGMRSTWKGGVICFEILLAGYRVMCWERKEIGEIRRAPEKREEIRFLPILNAILVLLPKIQRILAIVRASLRLRKLDCEIVYGSGDPVTTGIMYGSFCAVVLPVLPYGSAVSVRVNPVFDREIFSIRLDLILRLHQPLRLFIHSVALLLRKDTLDALRTLSLGGAR